MPSLSFTFSTKRHLWSDSGGGERALIGFDGWSHRWGGTFTPVKTHLGKEFKKKKRKKERWWTGNISMTPSPPPHPPLEAIEPAHQHHRLPGPLHHTGQNKYVWCLLPQTPLSRVTYPHRLMLPLCFCENHSA